MPRKKNLKNKEKTKSAGLDFEVINRYCPEWTKDAEAFTACALKMYPNDKDFIAACANVIRLGVLEEIMLNGLTEEIDYLEKLNPQTEEERALYEECIERLNQLWGGYYWKNVPPL